MPPEIHNLIAGYKEFKKKYYTNPHETIFKELTENGQKPKVLMIACSDSRVDPAIVTNSKPGDLFVIRNVANLVPPYENDSSYHGTSAALEFGVNGLDIEHIIVFGHSQCGGIMALVNANPELEKGFIAKWMEIARPAHQQIVEGHQTESFDKKVLLCTQYSLINSYNNLQTFPWIREKIKAGKLKIHAWYFDLTTGMISYYDPKKNNFKELS